MANEFSRSAPLLIGYRDLGTKTTFALDSALTIGTSGDCLIWGFYAREAQTSGALTVYVFVDSVTGSPTDVRCDIYATSGSDPDRYTGSALASSGAVDASSAGGTWLTFSLTGLTLTGGEHYWAVIYNNTGTPASNYPTVVSRSYWDGMFAVASWRYAVITAFANTAGFAADAGSPQSGPGVIKFDGGSLVGNPWVEAAPARSNNTNYRGTRLAFSEDVVVRGFGLEPNTTSISTIGIYTAAGATLVEKTPVYHSIQRSDIVMLDSPVTLVGGTTYELLWKPSTSKTSGTGFYMGEASPPADVKACAPAGGGVQWQRTTGATLGSLTTDDTAMDVFDLFVEELPAAAGGGGGGLLTHPGMVGGMRG